MFSSPSLAIFTETVSDPRFAAAAGIAVLAGVVRGFTGFGAALLIMARITAI
jgi:hypothetical protein